MRPKQTLLLLALLVGIGCRPNHPFVWAADLPPSEVSIESQPLRTGDTIRLTIPGMDKELQEVGDIEVTADGSIMVPFIGPVRVEGLTPAQTSQQLNSRLNGIIQDPNARVTVIEPRAPVVAVLGEVRNPGAIDIAHGEGLLTALSRAGGLTEFAHPTKIYVVRVYPEQQRVRFRYEDLVGGIDHSINFQLRDGDVIVVQ